MLSVTQFQSKGKRCVSYFNSEEDRDSDNYYKKVWLSPSRVLLKECLYLEGKLHSPDINTPSMIEIPSQGSKVLKWHREGKLHRDNDLPAIMKSGTLRSSEDTWYIEGKMGREGDKPSYLRYDDYNGSIHLSEEAWHVNGKYHRDRGLPARRIYNSDGVLTREEWRCEGVLHREDGPAEICYDQGGSKEIVRISFHYEGMDRAGFWSIGFWTLYEVVNEDQKALLIKDWLHEISKAH